MMIFVPSSPEKVAKISQNLQGGYENKRHAALYGNLPSSSNAASTSTSVLPPPPKSTFLASSALAHRSAGSQSHKSKPTLRTKTFKRNDESDLASIAPASNPGEQRDESLRLIETLPVGPKEMTPPLDDPHFLKFEPTFGLALRQRKTPHQEMMSHLEGRTYIPISTLYSVAAPERCDDGDYSIPVEGDWLTMGVIIKRSLTLETKPRNIDTSGRMLDRDGVPIVNNNDPFMTQHEKKKGNQMNGEVGIIKELEPKKFIIFTLLDISSQPDKFGQHDGSREIELAVFESDTSVVEVGGQRKYFGGSNGAYEKLLTATYGLVVCVLNPRVKKGYTGKKGPPNASQHKSDDWKYRNDQRKDKGPTRMRLNPRSGKSIALVGVARDYGQCQQEGCSTFVDKRMKMDFCDYHFGSRLEQTQNERPQLQSSWRVSTFGNEYSMANGMSGPKSKRFVFDSDTDQVPTLPGGKLYDVSTQLGRGKELRKIDLKNEMNSDKNQAKLLMSEFGNQLSEVKLKEMALAKIRKAKEQQADQEGSGGKRGILSNVMFESAGSKVIEASQKALLERKRQAEIELDNKGKGKKKAPRQENKVDDVELNVSSIPTGSYRCSNGDIKVLSDTSSKLLSRHSVKPSELSKPLLLRRKRAKLPPTVRPPPGESFYAEESSDEEMNILLQSDAMSKHLFEMDKQLLQNKALSQSQYNDSDSDSDLEIIPNTS